MTPRRRLLALAILALGVLVAAAAFVLAAGMRADPVRRASVTSLGVEGFVGLAAVAGALVSRRRFAERLGLGPGRLPAGALALLVLGTLGLSHALDSMLALSGLREGSALEDFEATFAAARGSRLALALLAIGVAPGIAEELLCRGLVQRGLEPRLGTGAAVAVAAVAFGALHLEPVHAASAGLLGLYLGAAAALAGSVRASALCHAVNNAVALVTVSVLPAPPLGAPGAALGLLLAGACLAGARGLGEARRGPPEPGLQEKPGSDDR